MEKAYCPNCNGKVNYNIRKNIIKEYKGQTVNVQENIAVCEQCGEDIFVPEIEDDNLKRLYDKYRQEKGIVSPADLIMFRERYGLSQRELLSILDWGKMTINRYERGALPTQSHSDYLKLIISNEEIFETKVEEAFANGRINERTYEKIKRVFKDNNKNLGKRYLISKLSHNESIFNGFRKFDIERLENLIGYIADKSNNLYQTSLNKYLWYIDMQSFRENVRSITGLSYIKYEHGPVIEDLAYKEILSLLNEKFYVEESEVNGGTGTSIKIKSKGNYDMSLFTEEEMSIIDNVISRLKDISCVYMSELSHGEDGWKKTPPREFISYDYAETLKLSI